MRPDKTESWVRSCLRKKKMPKKYADEVVKRAEDGGTFLRPYLCPHCMGYHVTSKPKVSKQQNFTEAR